MKNYISCSFLISALFTFTNTWAGGTEDLSEIPCNGDNNPCERVGSCSIQGSDWTQKVTIDTRDKYDTMGWSGLCDQIHVSLVQGNCDPLGEQDSVTVDLRRNSSAFIPSITTGTLACGGDSGVGGGGGGSGREGNGKTCSDEADNDNDGAVDCGDDDCFGNRACNL